MIHPDRAPVKPRVISPETGDAIPLEDILLEVGRESGAVIEIVGRLGSGKTTALAHLAATAPVDLGAVYLDDEPLPLVVESARRAVVVFSSRDSRPLRGATSYRLAPWDNDDLTEYLLAMHPLRCRSVLARLQAAPDRHLPRGLPELWRIVLDRMAEDELCASVSTALRKELHQGLPGASQRTGAEQYCLAELTNLSKRAAKSYRLLQRHVDARALRLLRHDAVRLTLATDRLAELLESESGDRALEERLPRELVKAVATIASSTAIQNLSRWIVKDPNACHPMAASLLHASVKGWIPDRTGWFPGRQRLPWMSGAYLDGATWKGVNLKGARIEECDLSSSDLTEAILDDAMASRANFSHAVLHRGSLVKIQAAEADFGLAVLTSINARSASFRIANFAGANLAGACLARADLRAAALTDAALVQADLSYAILTDAQIDGADFSSADFCWSRLSGLSLRTAHLIGARFSHAFLKDCDLEGVDLPEAKFAEAHLPGARLTGSRMPNGDFSGADLRGARLADIDWEGADLRAADLKNCTFHLGSSRSGLVNSPIASEGSRTGFYGDEFDQQTFRAPEEIRKANLCGADLREADLGNTDFYLVDLRGAKYTPSQFEHLRKCGAILFNRE
ncbi:MAG: pentapeptide repeat-containing protein [Thermoguttaceae bacterium]